MDGGARGYAVGGDVRGVWRREAVLYRERLVVGQRDGDIFGEVGLSMDIMDISYIGYGVRSYPQPFMQGWSCGRFEYGGHAKDCRYEGQMWLPPRCDPYLLELLIMGMQARWQIWQTDAEPTGTPLSGGMDGWYEHAFAWYGQHLGRLALPKHGEAYVVQQWIEMGADMDKWGRL